MSWYNSIKTKRTNQNNNESPELERNDTVRGSISSLAKDTAQQTGESFKDIGKGVFEQLLNSESIQENKEAQQDIEEGKKGAMGLENGTLFNYRKIEEERQIEEIKDLIKAIKQEVESIKKADNALMNEVSDIEKLTIDTLPEKPGIYHIRFLEVVLKVLQSLKLKISESGTWMEALKTKKAKRGSAFARNSKEKGTQYSMSKELQASRNIQ